MKTLILTRHAKSDWNNLEQKDYDRELNKRGLGDAPIMGMRLTEKKIYADLVIASPAKRAAQTAELVANAIGYNSYEILWIEKLYHASSSIIQDVILEVDDTKNTIIIVCHNNGITDFANSLSGFITSNMPTCAMIAFAIESDSWANFAVAKKSLLFYDYPKNA